MRVRRSVGTAAIAAMCAVPCATAIAGQLTVTQTSAPPGAEFVACVPGAQPCAFADERAENRYLVSKDALTREAAGQRVYAFPIAAGDNVKVLFAGANQTRTQLVVAFEQVSVPVSARLGGDRLSADQVHRAHWLSVRNPKSGEEIKAIDLGMLRPFRIGMSATGDYVWVGGDELQLRRREVRAYNARSGKLEFSGTVESQAPVRFFDRGFLAGTVYFAANAGDTGDGLRRHNSPNSFSIAEFTVRRTAALSSTLQADAAIGVIGFRGGTPELRDMLDSALAIKLNGGGFTIAERQRLKDLLQEARFQNLGLTDSAKAVELGRLANAQFLLFGDVQSVGTTSSLTLRLVAVADGSVKNGIELQCRDCQPDDYLQGLTFLIQDWIQ